MLAVLAGAANICQGRRLGDLIPRAGLQASLSTEPRHERVMVGVEPRVVAFAARQERGIARKQVVQVELRPVCVRAAAADADESLFE